MDHGKSSRGMYAETTLKRMVDEFNLHIFFIYLLVYCVQSPKTFHFHILVIIYHQIQKMRLYLYFFFNEGMNGEKQKKNNQKKNMGTNTETH